MILLPSPHEPHHFCPPAQSHKAFWRFLFLLSALHIPSQDIQICFIPGLPVATSLFIIHKWYDLWFKWYVSAQTICLREAFQILLKKILDALLKCYHIAISILQSSLAIFVLFPFRLSPLELNSLNMRAVLLTPTSAAPWGDLAQSRFGVG